LRGRPLPTHPNRVCSSTGGGPWDQACHQRHSNVQGVSQLRTRRRVTGHDTIATPLLFPPLSSFCSPAVSSKPGAPAETKGTKHQNPVAPNGSVSPYHEVGPAQLLLYLFVALLHPDAQAIQPHYLPQVCSLEVGVSSSVRSRSRQVGEQIPGVPLGEGGWVRKLASLLPAGSRPAGV
jgi:hypothetical protein